MGQEEILKTTETVAGIEGGRQVLGLTLQVTARDASGETRRLTADNVESIRASVASLAQMIGLEVAAFATVFDAPPVELNAGETLRFEQTSALVKTSPETVDENVSETVVEPDFI